MEPTPPAQSPPPAPPLPTFPGANHQPPKQGTSGFATVGFVLSLVGAILLSVILCLVALSRVKTYNQNGRALAIAGLVISGLWIPLFAVFGTVAYSRYNDGATTHLKVGECVTTLKEGDNTDLKARPCDQQNGGKVYAVFELPAGKWPGLTEIQAAAETGCTERFEQSGEEPPQASNLATLHPNDVAWRRGDRQITCLIVPA